MTPTHLSMSHEGKEILRQVESPLFAGPVLLTARQRRAISAYVEELRAVLKGYEALEASIIKDADWSNDTPCLTQEQFDEMRHLQDLRNAALKGDA